MQLIIVSLPIMAKSIGNPLLDKLIKDLIIQILTMITEQERTESNDIRHKELGLRKQMESIKDVQNYIVRTQNIPNVALFIKTSLRI